MSKLQFLEGMNSFQFQFHTAALCIHKLKKSLERVNGKHWEHTVYILINIHTLSVAYEFFNKRNDVW